MHAMTRRVIASFEDPIARHCVDVFRREDGRYGFEEFRAESDGGSRWQSLQRYGTLVYETGAEALAAAEREVRWLGTGHTWRW